MNYPQPHEGVLGTDRTDSLLSLDDTNMVTRDLLRGLSRHLSTAILVGNPAPVVQRMNERLRRPETGDLVVEVFSSGLPSTDDRSVKGLGVLLIKRQEWYHTDEQWEHLLAEGAYDSTEARPTDHVWYIQYGSSARDICRWTNCTFITLPWPDEQFEIPAGTREGKGTVFTRDSLLSSLADSGFELNLRKDER